MNLPRPVDSGPQSPPPHFNVPMDLFLKECTWFQREGLGSHWSLTYPFMPPFFVIRDDDLGFKGARTTMVIGAHNMTLKEDYVIHI